MKQYQKSPNMKYSAFVSPTKKLTRLNRDSEPGLTNNSISKDSINYQPSPTKSNRQTKLLTSSSRLSHKIINKNNANAKLGS